MRTPMFYDREGPYGGNATFSFNDASLGRLGAGLIIPIPLGLRHTWNVESGTTSGSGAAPRVGIRNRTSRLDMASRVDLSR